MSFDEFRRTIAARRELRQDPPPSPDGPDLFDALDRLSGREAEVFYRHGADTLHRAALRHEIVRAEGAEDWTRAGTLKAQWLRRLIDRPQRRPSRRQRSAKPTARARGRRRRSARSRTSTKASGSDSGGDGDSDEGDGSGSPPPRICKNCRRPCKPTERTCARCRKRRSRQRHAEAETASQGRQAPPLSDTQTDALERRLRFERDLLEVIELGSDGLPYQRPHRGRLRRREVLAA